MSETQPPIVILGLGNVLLADDGAGVHVIRALEALQAQGSPRVPGDVVLRDGGTIGLSLLTDIEDCAALVVVDAMELHAAPGTVAVFEGDAVMQQLGGRKKSAHEVALGDLLAAAALIGRAPARCALVGVQPGRIGWGMDAEGAVAEAVPRACEAVTDLIERWCVDA